LPLAIRVVQLTVPYIDRRQGRTRRGPRQCPQQHNRRGSISKIKDIIVNLEQQISRDPARDFAITVAETFDAHIAGIAFAYAPDFPRYVMLEIPPDIVAQMIAESEKAALAAIDRFDAAATRSQLPSEHRLLKTIGAEALVILSSLARRFDLSVFMQSDPNGVDNDDMIETSCSSPGAPSSWCRISRRMD
jgi:hypothetical protein